MFYFGDIYMAELPKTKEISQVQQGIKPVIVISNPLNNKYSPVLTVVPLTSQVKNDLPTHVLINGYNLEKQSLALCEQVTTIDKFKLKRKVGHITDFELMKKIQKAIMIQINVTTNDHKFFREE